MTSHLVKGHEFVKGEGFVTNTSGSMIRRVLKVDSSGTNPRAPTYVQSVNL